MFSETMLVTRPARGAGNAGAMRREACLLAMLALLLTTPGGVGAAPGLDGRDVAIGDMRATVWLWPGIFRPTCEPSGLVLAALHRP